MTANKSTVKKWFTTANVINVVFFAALALFVFYTPARVVAIRGLMKVGLFNPNVSVDATATVTAEDVAFQDKEGVKLTLSSFKGKVVFINFWATWCPPCIAELPAINDLRNRLKGNTNIVFITVDTDSDFTKSLPFMAKHGYNLPVYLPASRIPQSMMGNAIPATVVIDKLGKIAFRHDGMADYSSPKFEKFLTVLAAK